MSPSSEIIVSLLEWCCTACRDECKATEELPSFSQLLFCPSLADIYQLFTVPTHDMADINALLASVSSDLSPIERTVLLAALSAQASVQLNEEDIGGM